MRNQKEQTEMIDSFVVFFNTPEGVVESCEKLLDLETPPKDKILEGLADDSNHKVIFAEISGLDECKFNRVLSFLREVIPDVNRYMFSYSSNICFLTHLKFLKIGEICCKI